MPRKLRENSRMRLTSSAASEVIASWDLRFKIAHYRLS